MIKRLFFLISLVLVLCLASNASAAMLGWWTFDDSTADDSSGAGHHGTLRVVGANTVTFVFDVERDSNVAAFPGDPCVMISCGGGKALTTDPCTWADFYNKDTQTIALWMKTDGLFHESYQYAFAKENAYRVSRNGSTRNMRIYLEGGPDGTLGGSLIGTMDADDSQWHHYAAVYDGTEKVIYWDGERRDKLLDISEPASGRLKTTSTHDVTIGGHPGNSVRVWKGWLDDVRLYDNSYPQFIIRTWIGAYDTYNPDPRDTATYQEKTLAQLSWTGMGGTSSYRLYLGTDLTLVTNGDASVDKGSIPGTTMNYSGAPMGALTLGTIYYWRVDSDRMGTPYPGDIWQFETKPAWSENPWPFDGCKYVPIAQELSWAAGDGAVTSEVFISDNEQWVIDACDSIQTTINAPDPCVYSPTLAVDTTYYWKVDSDDGSVYTSGNVWILSTDAPSSEAGLVGYYPMEETDGSGTVTWDISGNMHHGTLVQGAAGTSIDIFVDTDRGNVLKTDTPTGVVNSALDLGGNADDVHDPCWGYVAQDALTVMMWAKPEEMHGTDYIYTRGNNVQLTNTYEDVPFEPNGPVRWYSSTLDDSTTNGPDWEVGEWQHVTITWDRLGVDQPYAGVGEPNEKRVYVNGALKQADVSTGPGGGDPLGTHGNTLVIGGRLDTGYNTRGYDGLLDEVKIYDIVLPCWKIVAEGAQCATALGDLDGDNDIDLADLNQLVGYLTSAKIDCGDWFITKTICPAYWNNCADMDGDGDIDLADLNRMVGNLTWEEITTGTPGTWSYPAGKYCP